MKHIFFVALLVFLCSCGTSPKNIEVPTDFKVEELISIMKNPELLDKEELAKIVGEEAAKIQLFEEYSSRNVSDRTVIFSWPNGEARNIKTTDGRDLEIEGKSSVGIGFLERISKQDFVKKYESKEAVQGEINRITQDENIDADIAIFEAKYLAANAKEQKFEKVGENAYWETPVNALHVFANGVAFTVSTNLESDEGSKQKAWALANLIFNN